MIYGCASTGIQTSTGEQATNVIAVFERGEARLNGETSYGGQPVDRQKGYMSKVYGMTLPSKLQEWDLRPIKHISIWGVQQKGLVMMLS
jgi:hypothetical protein